MIRQRWSCGTCGRTGTVTFPKYDGVMSVYNRLSDDHLEKSPACTASTRDLAVDVDSVDEEVNLDDRLPKHYHEEPQCIRCAYIGECGSLEEEPCSKRKVVR